MCVGLVWLRRLSGPFAHYPPRPDVVVPVSPGGGYYNGGYYNGGYNNGGAYHRHHSGR
ncbi:MAG: hypothetical protein WCC58_03680 [Burkholderiales bacterium]